MLMLVKYANMDLQATVGSGWNSGNTTHTTGGADGVLGVDGSATAKTANEAVLTMGIESFYGDMWKFMDGMYTSNYNVYVKDVLSMTADPASTSDLSTYTKLATSVVSGASNSAIKTLAYDTTYDYMIFPTSAGSPTPSNDCCWSAAGLDTVFLGGSAWNGGSDGLFTFASDRAVGNSSVSIGVLAVEFYD